MRVRAHKLSEAAAESAGGRRGLASHARRFGAEVGQSMVEMALICPLFLALIFSVIEFGRAWSAKQALTNAAREGARIMVLPYCDGCPFDYKSAEAVRTAAVQATKDYLASAGLDTSGATVTTIKKVPGGGEAGYTISENIGGEMLRGEKVGIKIVYPFDTPLPALLLSGTSPIRMSAVSLMEHE